MQVNKSITTVVVIGLALCGGAVSAETLALYVSPSGSDENPGSSSEPLATLQRARDVIRENGRAGTDPITVHLSEGTFYLREPLVLEPRDSGSREAPVTWLGRGSETTVSGGVRLTGLAWQPHRDGILKTQVPRSRIAHLERFDRLYANGVCQHPARYPNYDPDAKYFNGTAPDAIAADRVAGWADPAGGYLFALHRSQWGDMAFRIAGKDESGGLKMAGGWQNNRPTKPHEKHRYVENIFEELDAPGEWFYQERTETLYYYRPDGLDLTTARIVAAGLRSLVEVRGSREKPVTDVHFRNVTFSHSLRTFMDNREPLLRSDWCIYRGGALLFQGAERCGLHDCGLVDLGGNAVFFSQYNRGCEVTGCLLEEVGSSGVCFVGDPAAVRSAKFNYGQRNHVNDLDNVPGPKTNNYPADCRVHDCLITRTGRIEKQTAPVQISMSARITVSRCSIYDVPRAGINISEGTWGGHLVEFCDVFDTVKESGDHGSFNSWGRDRFWHLEGLEDDRLGTGEYAEMPLWDARETTVIRNSRWRCDHGWDIDLDDGSSNYHIYNNLCLRGGIKNREGFYRVVENNVMVNNTFHPHVWYRHSGDVFRRNIVFQKYRPIRVPKPWGRQIDDNLLHTPGRTQPQPATDLQEASGRDGGSLSADAMFVAPRRGDYHVREGSPALRLGFENFPMDRFGVTSPRLRARARTPQLPQVEGTSVDEVSASSRDGRVHDRLGAKVKNLLGLGEQSATGMHAQTGVLVVEVPGGSAAAESGLREHDVILGLGKATVHDVNDLLRCFRELEDERSFTLTVHRNQAQTTIVVTRDAIRDGSFLVGGDISALGEIEKHGGVFRSGGEPGDAIEIMTDHGCNCFRLRLFVDPTGRNVVTNDLPYTIALARRIKAAGARLLLNFHYSDTWADPGHQSKPKAWENLGFDALERRVYDYTRDCIAQFRAAGVLPEMVQPGNEITPGILWPDGKLYGVGDPNEQWDKFARLLKAGARGVRAGAGDGSVRIVLHIHCGGDFAKTKWFFDNIERRGVPYDIVGLSYYPWWHGTMEDLRENLRKTATVLGKDVFVVETAYPSRSVDVARGNDEVADRMRWPQTPQGQEQFLRELIQVVREVPDGRGLGVLWWYPESILVDGLHIWYGGAMALFDERGEALPALRACGPQAVPR